MTDHVFLPPEPKMGRRGEVIVVIVQEGTTREYVYGVFVDHGSAEAALAADSTLSGGYSVHLTPMPLWCQREEI